MLSPLELIGTVIGIVYVLLEYRANMWLWVAGFLMDVCYCIIYFQSHYYANTGLYLYYMVCCVIGGLMWLRNRKKAQEEQSDADGVKSMPLWGWIPVTIASALLTWLLWFVLQQMGESENAFFDGLTAALSCVGMVLMTKKYYQQWIFWIITNPMYIIFMIKAQMYGLAVMYGFYTVISVMGYLRWRRLSVK